MGFNYLAIDKNVNWSDITREERYFTCLLYNDLQNDHARAIDFITKNIISNDKREIAEILKPSDRIEVAYEVCLYRDLKKIKTLDKVEGLQYSDKRTFDLCIFCNSGLIVIEAKAQQGYGGRQLKYIRHDKDLIHGALGLSTGSIKIISLHSSLYHPSNSTLGYFDGYLTWEIVSKYYTENKKAYLRADSIHNK